MKKVWQELSSDGWVQMRSLISRCPCGGEVIKGGKKVQVVESDAVGRCGVKWRTSGMEGGWEK